MDGQLFEGGRSAMVSATDHGLVVGDGVFESLKVTPTGAYAVTRHLRRLSRSATAMGLPDPDHGAVRAAIETVLTGMEIEFGLIRITYTGGDGPLGSQAAYGPATLIVAAQPVNRPGPAGTIVTPPWTHNERGAMTGIKSTSYAENVRSLAFATERGAGEAVLANTVGNLCEGTGTNVFCVFGSEVVTPPLTAGPLAGITRELVLEWCEVTERDLSLAEARDADEIFLTSSTRDVQRVSQWDDRAYRSAPDDVTAGIARVFAERSQAEIDP